MSTWDQCCKGGKFNANFAKNQKTAKTLKESEKSKKNDSSSLFDNANISKSNITRKELSKIKYTSSVEIHSFLELGLNNYLLRWIEFLGFSSLNRVQNEVLQRLSERRLKHTIIQAPKKSGKTSATIIWILNELLRYTNKEYPKALMICPTVAIAEATYRFIEQVPKFCDLKIYLALQGKKISNSEQMSLDLVIATPDKALELSKLNFNLKNAKYLIFDDAHCMSGTSGNLKVISQVCSLLSSRCSIILCTLFCNKVLNEFIDKFLMQNEKLEIEIDLGKVIPKEIFIVYSNKEERVKAFIYLEQNYSSKGQTVVFCRTKDESNRLQSALEAANISVKLLNGSLKPAKRICILEQFKANKMKLLVTTYTFMEALEAENVTKVINYEQVLNSENKLDPDYYNQVENRLNGRKNCLIASFIEQKWEDALIQSKPGIIMQVYANATSISAYDLINGRKF